MKLRLLTTMAAATLMMLGTTALPALDVPARGSCANCPNGGVPKKDGTGPKVRKQGQGQGQNTPGARRQTGPRDGTGPLHTPARPGGGGGGRGGRR